MYMRFRLQHSGSSRQRQRHAERARQRDHGKRRLTVARTLADLPVTKIERLVACGVVPVTAVGGPVSDEPLRWSDRSRHDEQPLHRVRPERRDRRRRAERARADLSAARLGRARRARDLAQHSGSDRRRRSRARAATPATSPPSASPISARRRCSGIAARGGRCTTRSFGRTRAPRDLVAAYSRATAARTASAPRPGLPLATYFSALKLRWLLDHVPGARARAEHGDAAVRHDRLVAAVESHRRSRRRLARHRRHEREPHAAHGALETLDWDDELLAAFTIPRAVLPRIAASSEIYGAAQIAALARRADRRHPGRPAGGARRADLLRARRSQEHLRHGLLHADEHRRRNPCSRRRVS